MPGKSAISGGEREDRICPIGFQKDLVAKMLKAEAGGKRVLIANVEYYLRFVVAAGTSAIVYCTV
jgi:hypothetical protein